jgi:hypothetical protein
VPNQWDRQPQEKPDHGSVKTENEDTHRHPRAVKSRRPHVEQARPIRPSLLPCTTSQTCILRRFLSS